MPAELAGSTDRAHPLAAPSIAAELSYLAFALSVKDSQHESVRKLESTGLLERFRSSRAANTCGSELLLIAERAGLLFETDFDLILADFDEALEGLAVPEMTTETPEDRAEVADRLTELRESPDYRSTYKLLFGDLWQAVRDEWATSGLDTAQRQARLFASDLSRKDIRDLVPRSHLGRREQFQASVRLGLERENAVLVPLYFGGEGQFLTELADHLLFGVGIEVEERLVRRREHAEKAASALKVLADPTRLGILAALIHHPSSISDLAVRFDLAQPTISVHVKALREAGLLEFEKSGALTLYRSTEDRVRAAASEALDLAFRK